MKSIFTAIAFIGAFSLIAQDYTAIQKEGEGLMKEKKYVEAEAKFREAENSTSNVYYKTVSIGKIIETAQRRKDREMEEKELRRMIALPNQNLGSILDAYNRLGYMFYSMKKYPEAVNEYEKALELNQAASPSGHRTASYNGLAVVFLDMKNYDKSLETWKKIYADEKLVPDTRINAYIQAGRIMRDHLKKTADTQALMNTALAIQNLPPQLRILIQDELGKCYIQEGQYDQAIQEFRKITDCNEQIPEWRKSFAWLEIGRILMDKKNQLPEAKEAVEKALKISPDNRYAQSTLQIIENRIKK